MVASIRSVTALAVLGFLLSLSLARAALAQSGAARSSQRVLLVGALVSDSERVAQSDVYAAVLIGLRAGLESAPPCAAGQELCFERVDSYDDLIRRARMKQQISARGFLDSATMRSVLQASFREDKLSGYIGIQIIKLEVGFALEAVIFKESRDAQHPEMLPVRRKYLVAESGAGELVQLATELGQRIAMLTDSTPVARLRHETKRDVRVGTEVTLDASPSQDYDFDRLYWHWTQTKGPPVLPTQGTVRSVWRFVAAEAGEYEFQLAVSDCAFTTATLASSSCANRQPARETVIVTAGDPPHAQRFLPELISKSPHTVLLDASCTRDGKCSWTQIEGPQVPPAPVGALQRHLPAPGLYRFELEDENRFGREKSVKTYLVAPVPVPVPDVPSLVFMGNSAVLDGTGSFDPLGEPLAFSWSVRKAPRETSPEVLAAACQNTPDIATTYYITTPSAAESLLRVTNEGTYIVTLTVTARRKVDDHIVVQSQCFPKRLSVIQRRFELEPLGGFAKWGRPDGLALGMWIGGSVGLDARWRVHAEQILYRHVQGDDGLVQLQALGGTRLLISYGLPYGLVTLRPHGGFTFRGTGKTGEGWGPRVGYSTAFKVGNRFVITGGISLDVLYFFNENRWYPSPDLSFGFGFTL